MGAMGSQITSFTIVYSTVYSGADQRKHQSSASLAYVLANVSNWWRHHGTTRKLIWSSITKPSSGYEMLPYISFDKMNRIQLKWQGYLHIQQNTSSKDKSSDMCFSECKSSLRFEVVQIYWEKILDFYSLFFTLAARSTYRQGSNIRHTLVGK